MVSYCFAAVLSALAFEHMAYIIQYGSIFDTPRAWIDKQQGWSWRKLSELCHCQTCTVTQLSFWLWALPIALRGTVTLDVIGPVGTMVAVWFSQSALSLMAYDLARLIGRGSEALIQAARRWSK